MNSKSITETTATEAQAIFCQREKGRYITQSFSSILRSFISSYTYRSSSIRFAGFLMRVELTVGGRRYRRNFNCGMRDSFKLDGSICRLKNRNSLVIWTLRNELQHLPDEIGITNKVARTCTKIQTGWNSWDRLLGPKLSPCDQISKQKQPVHKIGLVPATQVAGPHRWDQSLVCTRSVNWLIEKTKTNLHFSDFIPWLYLYAIHFLVHGTHSADKKSKKSFICFNCLNSNFCNIIYNNCFICKASIKL